MNKDDIEEELELDILWIEKYKKDINKQLFFFVEPIKNIKIFNIYIKNNKIVYYHKKKIYIKDSKIENINLLKMIERFKKIKDETFKIKDILKFQVTINNNNITKFLKNKYLINLEKMDLYKDIYFIDCINIFKNLNCLYLIYEINELNTKNLTAKKRQKKHKVTKKIY